MEIKLFQSGGFAGERIQLKELSDNELSAEKKTMLQGLLQQADFYTSKKNRTSHNTNEGFDNNLEYEIAVKDEKGEHTLRFQKSEESGPLNAVLHFIMNH